MLATVLIVLAVLCLAAPFAVLRFGPAVRRACIGVREGELFPFDVLGGLLLIAALGSLAL